MRVKGEKPAAEKIAKMFVPNGWEISLGMSEDGNHHHNFVRDTQGDSVMRRFTLSLAVLLSSFVTMSTAQAQNKGIKLPVNSKPIISKPVVNKPPVINPPGVKPPVVKPPVVTVPQPPVVKPPMVGPHIGVPPGGPVQSRQLIIDPSRPNQLAYFSNRLGARFLIEQMYLPQFGTFWGARIVSRPVYGSPLQRLGLDEGDVITRLDGVPVTRYEQLEQHIFETGVRFMKAGDTYVFRKTVYIYQNRFYPDPYGDEYCEHGYPVPYGQVSVRP